MEKNNRINITMEKKDSSYLSVAFVPYARYLNFLSTHFVRSMCV